MTGDLPEFSGELSHCVQCDDADARTEYTPAEVPSRPRSDRYDPDGMKWPSGAFLKRICRTCDFEWAEATRLDKPAPPEREPMTTCCGHPQSSHVELTKGLLVCIGNRNLCRCRNGVQGVVEVGTLKCPECRGKGLDPLNPDKTCSRCVGNGVLTH